MTEKRRNPGYHWERFLKPYLKIALPDCAATDHLLEAGSEHDMWWNKYRTLVEVGMSRIPLEAALDAFRHKVPANVFVAKRMTHSRR